MKTNLPTKKILGTVIILNVVALTAYFYVFSFIKSKNESTSVSENVLSSQISRESELKLVGASLKRTEKERALIESYFVQEGKGEIADFVEVVESMSRLAGVSMSVSSILLKNQEEDNVVEELNLGLEVKGSWAKTVYFLEFLEALPYKLSFNRFYIEKIEDSSLWESTFNISVLKLSDN